MILIILGILFVAYDWSFVLINPGTLYRIIFSISHIFTFFGGYLIFEGVYKRRKGKYWFSTWKKNVKVMVISIITAGISMCLVQSFFIWTPDLVEMTENADYVIVLGGGIDRNGKLPKNVQKRIKKAENYLKLHEDSFCVVSGGQLKQVLYPEAPAMKEMLVNLGICEDRVLVEDKALDTIQNLQKSCILLSETQNKTVNEILDSDVLIVTSSTHLARAERLARRLGFTSIKGIKADVAPYSYLMALYSENCSYLKLNLRILLTGKPVSMREDW